MKKLTSPFAIISRSVSLFFKKENLLALVKIYAPLGILSLLAIVIVYIPLLAAYADSPTGSVVLLIFNILTVFVSIFVGLEGILASMEIISGKVPDTKSIYNKSLPKYKSILLLTVALFVIYMLGAILFVIPAIIAVNWFAFSKFILVEKGVGVKESLLQSRKLVKGKFWKILLRLVVFALFYLFMKLLSGVLPYGSGIVLFSLGGALFILPLLLLYKEL